MSSKDVMGSLIRLQQPKLVFDNKSLWNGSRLKTSLTILIYFNRVLTRPRTRDMVHQLNPIGRLAVPGASHPPSTWFASGLFFPS